MSRVLIGFLRRRQGVSFDDDFAHGYIVMKWSKDWSARQSINSNRAEARAGSIPGPLGAQFGPEPAEIRRFPGKIRVDPEGPYLDLKPGSVVREVDFGIQGGICTPGNDSGDFRVESGSRGGRNAWSFWRNLAPRPL